METTLQLTPLLEVDRPRVDRFELVGQLADFRGRVRRWPPRVFRNGSLSSLAQWDTVLGDNYEMSATSAARRS
jgi:hypothetical protein